MNHEEEKSYVTKQTARVGNGFRLFGSLIEANGGFFPQYQTEKTMLNKKSKMNKSV